jgi:hypothetical protein
MFVSSADSAFLDEVFDCLPHLREVTPVLDHLQYLCSSRVSSEWSVVIQSKDCLSQTDRNVILSLKLEDSIMLIELVRCRVVHMRQLFLTETFFSLSFPNFLTQLIDLNH